MRGKRVARLIQTKFTSTGQLDHHNRPPALFNGSRALDLLQLELLDRRLDVVTHHIEFVRAVLFRRVNSHFGRWEGEDEPAFTSINMRKIQDVAEEPSVSLGIRAVDDSVCSRYHSRLGEAACSLTVGQTHQ